MSKGRAIAWMRRNADRTWVIDRGNYP